MNKFPNRTSRFEKRLLLSLTLLATVLMLPALIAAWLTQAKWMTYVEMAMVYVGSIFIVRYTIRKASENDANWVETLLE